MRQYLAMLPWPKDDGHVVTDVGGQREGFSGPGPGKSLSCCLRSLSGCEIYQARDFFSSDFTRRPGFMRFSSVGRVSGRISRFRNWYRFVGVTKMIKNFVISRFTGFADFSITFRKFRHSSYPKKRTAARWCTISFYILLSHDYLW